MCQNPSVLSVAGSDSAFPPWAAVQTLSLPTGPHHPSSLVIKAPWWLPCPSSWSALSLAAPKLCSLPADAHFIGKSPCSQTVPMTHSPQGGCSAPGCWTQAISTQLNCPPPSCPTSVFQTSLHTQLRGFLFFLSYTFYL